MKGLCTFKWAKVGELFLEEQLIYFVEDLKMFPLVTMWKNQRKKKYSYNIHGRQR